MVVFNDFFKQLITKVNVDLEKFYDEELKERDYTSSFYKKLHFEVKDYLLSGGKRFRPLLFFLSYLGYNNSLNSEEDFKNFDVSNVLHLASSIELFHSFLLIHDDIVDRDDYRRGKPTVHKRIEKLLPKGFTKPEDLGIIAGDLVLMHAFKLLLKSNIGSDKKVLVQNFILERMINTLIGQSYDLLDVNKNIESTSFENVLFVMTYKTSRYTIFLPLALGALLNGYSLKDNPEEFEKFEEISNLLGVAFHLKKDLQGIYSNEKYVDSSLKSDIELGKKTLLMKWLYDVLDDKEKLFLNSKLGSKISEEDHNKIKKLLEEKGIKSRVEKYIVELLEDSKKEIEKLNMNSVGKKYLLELTEFLL